MAELISHEPDALQMISRFNLPLGVGEKTIGEVCEQHHVDAQTFLTIINYRANAPLPGAIMYEQLSLPVLMDYLKNTHSYFFEFSLPNLRQKLIESINLATTDSQIPILIIKFFDEWVSEINLHMAHENERLFPYVEGLLRGNKPTCESLEQYEHQHSHVDDTHIATKLTELKNLIIKYYPTSGQNHLLNSALYDIFQVEQDLANHCAIEDHILLPAVKMLEKRKHTTDATIRIDNHADDSKDHLTEREKDVLVQVVNGLSNKEIADVLSISVHTVITHRKNIAAKLDIHSTAGLTIYAIINNLVRLDDLK